MMFLLNDDADWIYVLALVAGGRCNRFTHAAMPSRTGDTQKPAAIFPVASEIAPARIGPTACPSAKATVRSEMAAVHDEAGSWRCTTMVIDVGPAMKLPPNRTADANIAGGPGERRTGSAPSMPTKNTSAG